MIESIGQWFAALLLGTAALFGGPGGGPGGGSASLWAPNGSGLPELVTATVSDGCAEWASNVLTTTGTDCGTGSGGSGNVATSTTESRGLLAYWTSDGATPATLGEVATTSLTASSPLTLSQPISVIGSSASALSLDTSGTWTGNAGTASALAADPTDCSAGSFPLGINAAGTAQNCTDAWTEAENTAAAYAAQATTLTIAGTANQITSSAGAQSLAANRTWTLSLPSHVIFPGSFVVSSASSSNATTTNLHITGLSQVPLYVDSNGKVGSAGTGSSGNCVQWGANNTLTDAGAACGTGSGDSVPLSMETPSGTVNGSNTDFTVNNTPSAVFVNGQYMKGEGEDYTYSAPTISFVTAPPSGSILTSLYGGGVLSFSYPFPNAATSTTLTFNEGLLSLASTTIGDGTALGGLTVSGTATTTDFVLTSAMSAGCAQFSALGVLSSTGVACGTGSGGGGGEDFTYSQTNFGLTTSATSTPLWLQGGLMASSTIYSLSFVPIASTTQMMTIDFCDEFTNNILASTTGAANTTLTLINADNCIGKSILISLTAPSSGVIGSTTLAAGSGSGPVIWDGGTDPGNSVVNSITDDFCLRSAATTTTFIAASLCGSH